MTSVSTAVTPVRTVRLSRADDVEGWRAAARAHLGAGTAPESLVWEVTSASNTLDLFAADENASVQVEAAIATATADSASAPVDDDTGAGAGASAVTNASAGAGTDADAGAGTGAAPIESRRPVPPVPSTFLELAERVVCHRDRDRFALLYRVLWRRANGEPALLACQSDPDVHRLHRLGKAVSRERHKMHAFVRFRRTPGVEPEHFGAWFEPEHHTLRLSSGFFVRRFATMRFSIVTPEESVHWNGEALAFGPGGRRGDRAESEAMEALWRTYFASIFDPARLRLDAMRSEMPVKYWKNLPEAPLIAELIRDAGGRSAAMLEAAPGEPPRFAAAATAPLSGAREERTPALGDVPASVGGTACAEANERTAAVSPLETFTDLAALRERTRTCALCEHACRATRTVDGEGPADARLMIVGEQAGDREDLSGRPFVGPAGALLRTLLERHGTAPESLYLTNAVRHFRYEARGKRRLHRRPDAVHVDRCRRWLFEEIRLVRPAVIVALGATAGQALLGRAVRVEQERGSRVVLAPGCTVHLSAHPASVLRAVDPGERERRERALSRELAEAIAAPRRAAGVQ